jgi:hypothetical protein
VRGADCFFWSLLLRGKAGYSTFYMNPGIDTGDIITKHEFEVDLSHLKLENYSDDETYISILKFYDPCLQIMSLIYFLDSMFKKNALTNNEKDVDMREIPSAKQDVAEGRMYFFMHKCLRDSVIDSLKSKKGSS